MPTHSEKRILPYTPEQIYALVAQVEHYPKFLPWCLASRITSHEDDIFYADLIIGYKMMRERFTSKVTLTHGEHVHVEYIKGPMKHLSNHWRFREVNNGSCELDFYVDFEFKNQIFQSLMGAFFDKAVRKMVEAFETRADDLYGSKS